MKFCRDNEQDSVGILSQSYWNSEQSPVEIPNTTRSEFCLNSEQNPVEI